MVVVDGSVDDPLKDEMNLIEKAVRRLESLSLAVTESLPDTSSRRPDLLVVESNKRPEPEPRPVAEPPKLQPSRKVNIDFPSLERAGTLVPVRERTVASEEFRHIKRPILKTAGSQDEQGRSSLVMVTSALPGEGKTFFALNLAMSLAAEIDTSVLLVDVDVLRPSVLSRLGVSSEFGLLDLLSDDKLKLNDVVLSTNVPNLQLLGSGSSRSTASELLSSQRMKALMGNLCAPGRVVVFDGPPLLVTNEARVLAGQVGQVVFVVEAMATPQSAVARALESLQSIPNVSVVLNRSHPSTSTYGYGYDYY